MRKRIAIVIAILFLFGCAGIQTNDFMVYQVSKHIGYAMKDDTTFCKTVKEVAELIANNAPPNIVGLFVPDVLNGLTDGANLNPLLKSDIQDLIQYMGVEQSIEANIPINLKKINLEKFENVVKGLYVGIMLEVA